MIAQPNDYAGNGTDLCRVCGYPTRNHEMKPCPVLGLDFIIGQPLPRTPNGRVCHRTGCDEPVRKSVGAGPKPKFCSRRCGQKHNARLARGWGDSQDEAYEEAR